MLPGTGILGAIGRIASKHAKVVSQVLGTRSPHKRPSGKNSSVVNMNAAENGSDQEDMDTKEGMFEVCAVSMLLYLALIFFFKCCRFKRGFKRDCISEGIRRCCDGGRHSQARGNFTFCCDKLFQTEGNRIE